GRVRPAFHGAVLTRGAPDVDAEAPGDTGFGTGIASHRAATSDAAPLGRAAAVVGDRSDGLDAGDLDAGVLDRADGRLAAPGGGLAARAGALTPSAAWATADRARRGGGRLGGHLGREGGGLAGSLEADVA